MAKPKILIIGGGFAGCIATQMLTEKNYDVTLIEKQSVLGGACRTYWHGGHPYNLGPRHFLTRDEAVYDFLNKSCPMHRYDQGHEFLTYVEQDSSFYHFPIHQDEIGDMPDSAKIFQELAKVSGPEGARNLEEYWVHSVGETLYGKYIDSYSKKMWGIESNTEITDFGFTPKGVALKTGSKAAWDEAISGFPLAANGYDDYFPLAVKDATVHLDTEIEEFDLEKTRVKVDGDWQYYDIIISTISPEIVMKDAYGPLRWMGRDFLKLVLPVKKVFPDEVYFLYYANQEPFTRVVEYKKFFRADADSPTTLLGIEVPSNKNRLYPFPMKKDQDIHQRYVDNAPDNVYWIGRNGSYRYLDVGLIIQQCMKLFKDF